MTVLREFGPWVTVDLDPHEIEAVRQVGREIKARLGIRETPIAVRRTTGGATQLRARHVAGFVQIGDKAIEIAPKFLRDHDGASWRDAFLAILAQLGRVIDLPRVNGARSDTGLPDLMGLVVDDALRQAMSEGLPRRYEERRASLNVLRGQLDTERLWRRFAEPGLVPCRFDEFTEDTPAARLLKWAATELGNTVASPSLAADLSSHADALVKVMDELPSELLRDRISVPPQYGYLSDAVEVARILADGDVLSMSRLEDAPARAFLWDTATVFEGFVFEVCRAGVAQLGGTAAKTTYELATPLPGHERRRQGTIPTTPDVVVSRHGWTGLLDAKYKRLGTHPKTSDVYQVMAGGRLLGLDAVALIYPGRRGFRRPRSWLVDGEGSPRFVHALPLDLNAMARPGGFRELSRVAASWMSTWETTGGRQTDSHAALTPQAGSG